MQLATAYIDGTDTYSGGVDAATFNPGDEVELIVRDSTTLTTEALTILAVNAGSNQIVFTSTISGGLQTDIAAGWVDLRYAPFATPVQASQQSWMFVGDDVTSVIGGTSEPARPIAP